MRQEKESLSNYLLRIHKEELGYEYEEDTVLVKKYKHFIRSLNFHENMTDAEEAIFREFLKANETLKSFYKKGVGQTEAKKKLQYLYNKAIDYYTKILYPQFVSEAKCLSPKDAQIHLLDAERLHSIPIDLEPTEFIYKLEELWNDFFNDYFRILSASELGICSLSQAVEDEIEYYNAKVKNYNQPINEFENANIDYYTGQNDNPYKNLYIYCLFQYIKYYLDTRIPVFSVKQFDGLEALRTYRTKKVLSLRDVAQAYALVSNLSPDKVYDRIKKQFQKYGFFQSCKNGEGNYQFRDITEPLAFYEIYRKKNIERSEFTDKLILYVYSNLIGFAIDGKIDNIEALEKYNFFFKQEYQKLADNKLVCDEKFETFIEILMYTAGRLSLRLIAPKEEVNRI